MADIIIHWFRRDLRLADNPSLSEAARHGKVLPIYILDDCNSGEYFPGAASQVWLHYSLLSLNASLDNNLSVYKGDPADVFSDLIGRFNVNKVFWNRCYEPWCIKRDAKLETLFSENGVEAASFNGTLLWEPRDILKADKTPYRVFTPFYRKGCLAAGQPREPLPVPEKVKLFKDKAHSLKVQELELLPEEGWDSKLAEHWGIGEHFAKERLDSFLENGMSDYKEGRNYPAKENVSRLSPYLHFGEISPNQLWYSANLKGDDRDVDCFCSELGWREFAHNLLYFNPDLPKQNLQRKFDAFPWREDEDDLKRWQMGLTGYPIVDAGMRELWQTGYMHNRVRMITGSFLVKNLLLHWRYGERWFWDCLVDADLANNSMGWQWIAGCGADAAPYFRIFNPVTQGKKFDPQGDYTRRFVPELSGVPDKYLFCPWEAPEGILEEAGVELGVDYPMPIVDIKASRERALEAFRGI
ncbi:MAG: cryptochrome/photolyase family protein [Methyloligellaceae bacterium]